VSLLREHQGCQQIERYDFLSELRARISSGNRWTTARVVNQDIEATKSLFDGINDRLRCSGITNICADEGSSSSAVSNGRGGLTATHGDYLCPLTKQYLTDSATNMTGATGHETYFSFQLRHCCIHYGVFRLHTL
jgi:hypothetical protein